MRINQIRAQYNAVCVLKNIFTVISGVLSIKVFSYVLDEQVVPVYLFLMLIFSIFSTCILCHGFNKIADKLIAAYETKESNFIDTLMGSIFQQDIQKNDSNDSLN